MPSSPWTIRTGPGPWGRRGEVRRSTSAWWARSISSPRRSGRRWAGPPAASRPVPPRSRTISRSAPAPSCSPTPCPRPLRAVRYLVGHPELVTRLHENARYFRDRLSALGFKPLPGETAIVPVILGETAKAIQMSELLLGEGVFVTGFGYPVVAHGHARIRCQLSAAHTKEDLDFALAAFQRVGTKLGLL